MRNAILRVDNRLGVEYGHGADERGVIPMSNHTPNEPDLFIKLFGVIIGAVEVSGSDKARVPPNDMLVRLGKLEHAMASDYQTWFLMVYPRRTVVLTSSDAFYCRNNTTKIEGDRDLYVRVPYSMARPVGELFDWLRECLRLYSRGNRW